MRFFRGKLYDIETLSIGENQLGYIYAWKPAPDSGFQLMPSACSRQNLGHANCILPNGQLVGFGFNQAETQLNTNFLQRKLEIGLPGLVAFNEQNGRAYSDWEAAIRSKIHSSVLIMEVSPHQIKKFSDFWKNDPGSFTKFSNNCSRYSYNAFRSADLVGFGLTPIMTPKTLYDLLLDTCKRRHVKFNEKAGFVGIEIVSDAKNHLIIANERQ